MSLSRIQRTVLPIAVIALLGGCLGCAVRSPRSIYELSKIDSEYFLLSPDAGSTAADHQTIRIPRPDIESQKDRPVRDCSIKGPWFSLYADAGNSSLLDSGDAERIRISTERRNHRHERPMAGL